jgi:beta-lactam-binding protein with PASTA domain
MLQDCLFVAGVNDHSSLIVALDKYKDQESRLKEVVNAHEELKQQKLKVKEREEEENKAAEGLIRTDSRIYFVRGKHKHNKRQGERIK